MPKTKSQTDRSMWRITKRAFADLSGDGGKYASGRWHTIGRPILYTADTPSLAMLEYLANADAAIDELPNDLVLIKISLDDRASAALRIEQPSLPTSWCDVNTDSASVRYIGDAWLAENESLLLFVPTVLVPEQYNILINPAHHDADKMTIEAVFDEPFDTRLI